MSTQMNQCVRTIPAIVAILLGTAVAAPAQQGARDGEWRYYGADAGSTKYSTLDQIDRDNVADLQIAWRWRTDNFGPRIDLNYQATPLMVGGVLYTSAGWRRNVAAIDGATGETLWMYRLDEGERGDVAPVRASSGRGVAYWTDGQDDERIIHVTRGYRLVSLDAATGLPVPTFGEQGVVDLFQGINDGTDRPQVEPGQIGLNSPALVVGDVIVVGAALRATAPAPEFTAGFVRGFDARTGEQLWIFHTIPQPGEFGNDTWENDSWRYSGNTGVWAPMSADHELGYVYVPVETPTNDLYGGHRPGDNLFAESLVCLDARTGERVWHYQLIHHGIWDYDIPTPPTLIDITVDGREIKAVAQITKQAFTYVFDRVTGEPVWPIEERPVPASTVPGEQAAPTQPFPTRPAPFDRQGVSNDDLLDFTPELAAEARRIASEYQLGPIYTPPILAGQDGLRALLMLPQMTGGANWQGGAVDAETGILYVASATAPTVAGLINDPNRSTMDYVGGGGRRSARDARQGCGEIGPLGLPLIKPPWGRITAIDLNSGEHVWMIPNGDTPDCVRNHPALSGVDVPRTGKPSRSGILVTKTLVFAGEGGGLFATPTWAGGEMFHAYDKQTGETIWEMELPKRQSGVPMTYMIDGKQYIVMAMSARGEPAELVALTLP